jgi:hypothetical protein
MSAPVVRAPVAKAIIVGIVWIALEYVALGPFSYFRIHDNGNVIIPALLTQSALSLERPLWYPFAGGGADRLALGYFAGLDVLLFKLLPGWLAYQLLVLSQFVLATVFTHLLARRALNLPELPSAIAGFAYALSVVSGQLAFSALAYLPLVIWGLSRALDSPSPPRRWAVAVALALFYGLTAHAQLLLPFPFVVIVVWFWLLEGRRRPRDYLLIVAFCALATALRLQDIVALAANGGLSHRYDWGAGVTPERIVERTFEHLYWSYWRNASGTDAVVVAKVTAVVFLLGALFKPVRTRAYGRLLGFVLVLALAPLVAELAAFALGDALPLVTKFSFLRFHFFLYFALALGAAQVLATLPRDIAAIDSRRVAVVVTVGLLLVQSLVAKAGHVAQWLDQGNYVAAYRSPVLRELAARAARSGESLRVATVGGNPAFLHAYGLETADGYLTLYPRRYKAFWERVIAPTLARDTDIRHYFRYFASHFYLFGGAPAPRLAFAERYDLALLSLANTRFVLSRDPLIDEALIPIVEPARPWSELSATEQRAEAVRANFSGSSHWYLYENRDALPRYFLAGRVVALADGKAVLDAISRAPAAELGRTAFVAAGDVGWEGTLELGAGRGAVTVLAQEPDRIELALISEGPAVLVGGNAYTPYWRALVDGAPAPIFPVDHAFWGVRVEAGEHRVVFQYEPPQRFFSDAP